MTTHRLAIAALAAAGIAGAAIGPAAACGKGEVLYRDNFAWVDASWQLNTKAAAIEAGALTLKVGPKESYQVDNESGFYTNANICVDVNFESGNLESAIAALVFWFQPPDLYTVVLNNGQVALARSIKNEFLYPAAARPVKSLRNVRGQWNTLELQTRDRNVRLLVNGEQAFSVNGSPPPNGGKLSLGAVNGGDGTIVVKFRNFVVESAGVPGVPGVRR